jgi:hypothetical protein
MSSGKGKGKGKFVPHHAKGKVLPQQAEMAQGIPLG